MKRPIVFAAVVSVLAVFAATAGNILMAGVMIVILSCLLVYMHTAYALSKAYYLSIIYFILVYTHSCMVMQGLSIDSRVSDNNSIKAHVKGTISDIVQKDGYSQIILDKCEINLSGEEIFEKISGNVLVNAKSADILPGDEVYVDGKISAFDNSRNAGNFDSRKYYRSIGILYKTKADKIEINKKNSNQLKQFINNIKGKLQDSYNKILDENDSGIISSVVLGDKSSLNSDIKELYQKNGIAHLLAISGVHISIIGMGIYKILRRMGIAFFNCAVISSILILSYGIMTGNQISAVRAIAMFIISVTAEVIGRSYDCLSALALSLIMILWNNPYALENTGCLLSFSAVIGISAVNPILNLILSFEKQKLTRKMNVFAEYILKAFIMSFSINIVTFPIIISSYYEFPLYSIFLNLIVVPFMSIVMLSGLLGGIAGCFNTFTGTFILGIAHYILEYYQKICEFVSKLPFSTIICGSPGKLKCIIYYLLLIIVLLLIFTHFSDYEKAKSDYKFNKLLDLFLRIQFKSKKNNVLLCALVYISAFFVLILNRNTLPKDIPAIEYNLEIDMIDVGQGDCIFMETPDNSVYLFDGGSTDISKVGKYRIIPFLKSKGIDHIDYAVISHSDDDHTNGIIEIMQFENCGIKIKNIILPGIENYVNDDNYCNVVKLAADNKINVIFINSGEKINDTKDFLIKCIHPVKGYDYESANDYSGVFLVKYKEFEMLMTGDAGQKAENAILSDENIRNIISNTDILKVGHHGSKTSTTNAFLSVLSPKAAFISCGIDNSYGHPSNETLKRLNEEGVKNFITSEAGQISLTTDGINIQIDTMFK